MGDGLIDRVLRAMRLDPTVYREVAAPGASTEQAAFVLMLGAIGFGFAHSADRITGWLNFGWSGVTRVDANAWIVGEFENGRTVMHALGLMAAWPIWAVCLCLISKRVMDADQPAPGVGQIARALAFAQAPGMAGMLLLIPSTIASVFLVPDVSLPHSSGTTSEILEPLALPWLGLLVNVGIGVLLIWVFVGTYLALCEAAGLRQGQALAAIVLAAAAITVLVAVALTLTSIVAAAVGVIPSAFGADRFLLTEISSSVFDLPDISTLVLAESPTRVALGFDFNLGWYFIRELISRLDDVLVIVVAT